MAGLLEEGVLLEEFGGETQCAHISAKTGTGLDDLLDKISLQVSPPPLTVHSHLLYALNVETQTHAHLYKQFRLKL